MIDVLFFLNFEQCALNIHNDNLRSLIRIGQFLLNVWEGYILIRSALSMDHKFITKMDKNSDWADTREKPENHKSNG